jgi:hypothetical protein
MKPGSLFKRYLPFVAIALLQVVLVTMQPKGVVLQSAGPGGAGTFAQSAGGAYDDSSGAAAAGIQADGAPAAGGASASVQGGVARPAGAGAAAASAQAGAGGAASAKQPLDALGRPLAGDKSKCDPDGLVQQKITRWVVPCMPKFEGDNGGNTWQGVTRDTIVGVLWFHKPDPEVDTLLASQGFAQSPESGAELLSLLEKFLNLHYELYGRKLKLIQHVSQCDPDDASCPAIEAKAINEKYHPFFVGSDVAAATPQSATEQFARLGVIVTGAPYGFSREWFQRMAPFAWSYQADGTYAADAVADYYCKKMVGKVAKLAGDPVLQTKKRKLAIVSSENPPSLESGQHLLKQITGGQCGSKADGHTIYTLSVDPAQAEEQQKVLVTRMKNDGITTVYSGSYGCGPTCDQEQFYPENLMGNSGPWDVDPVARLLIGISTTPAQARNLFGLGWYPQDPTTQQHDFALALRTVAPNYGEFPYIFESTWQIFHGLVSLIQFTGPKLTPQNVARAAETMPQANGWKIPSPWPGWKCCNAQAAMIRYGPGDFSAISDAREVYWDANAISKNDGKPGAMVCPDGDKCQRYAVGEWASGDPVSAGSLGR